MKDPYFITYKDCRPIASHIMDCIMRCLLVLTVLFIAFLPSRAAFSADEAPGKTQITVALIKNAFVESSKNDLAAAFKAFAKIISKQKGYDMEITVSIFKDISELVNLPENKRPQVVTLDSWSFLQMEKEGWLTPVTISSVGKEKVHTPYKILVPSSSKTTTIEDLHGKTLNILFTSQTEIGVPWLCSLLRERNLGKIESFFEDISFKEDPMEVLLPVFFEQRDAGLISEEEFGVMAKLNPQLREMRVIAVSRPLISAITAVSDTGWGSPGIKQDFIDVMLELHLSPEGQQILGLFKTDQIVAYQPEEMEPIRAIGKTLITKHPHNSW